MGIIARQDLEKGFSQRLTGRKVGGEYTIGGVEIDETQSLLLVHVIGNGRDRVISVGLGEDGNYLCDEALDLVGDVIDNLIENDEALQSSYYSKDYESLRDRLFICPSSIKSKRLPPLNNIPYLQIGDIVFTYKVSIQRPPTEAPGWESYLTLSNKMLAGFGLSRVEIHADALRNTMQAQNPYLMTLKEKLVGSNRVTEYTSLRAHVAGTKPEPYGAVVMLYPGFMEMAADRLAGSFYILPSSIHELLFLSDRTCLGVDELEETVRSINRESVPPEYFLSDNVYYYDAEKKDIILARKREEVK